MKSRFWKIVLVSSLLVLFGAGVSFAGDDCSGYRGRYHGRHKVKVHHHYYHYAPPRPVHVVHHHRPVVVERHYYPQPVYYASPTPSGFFFGMSVLDAGSAFSFGVSGR